MVPVLMSVAMIGLLLGGIGVIKGNLRFLRLNSRITCLLLMVSSIIVLLVTGPLWDDPTLTSLASLDIVPGERIMAKVGDEVKLAVTAEDKEGNKVDVNAWWMVMQPLGTLSRNYGSETVFTATKPGRVEVVAKAGELSATVTIDIIGGIILY